MNFKHTPALDLLFKYKRQHTLLALTSRSQSIQEIIIDYLKKSFFFVKKIIYFTDGAAQHFKNKHNFQNLHHYEDFSVEAEWHFHATAHGKNACDGIGASIKSNARRAS